MPLVVTMEDRRRCDDEKLFEVCLRHHLSDKSTGNFLTVFYIEDSLNYFVLSRGTLVPAFEQNDYEKLSGQDVFLTIDMDYQKILSEELIKQLQITNSDYANGVIVNPFSGE